MRVDGFDLHACLGIVRAQGVPAQKIEAEQALMAAQQTHSDSEAIGLIAEALPDYGRHYEEAQQQDNVIDFDGMLISAVTLLRAHPDVRDELSSLYPYIQVDEFQDTNRVQLDLVTELAGEDGNICVVGDDRQSIYAFRGADTHIFETFKERYPKAVELQLRSNYRSAEPIVEAANASARYMLARQHLGDLGDMVAGRHILQPQRPEWWVFATEKQEAEAVVSLLRSLPDKHTVLVVYRLRTLKNELETALTENEIAYDILDDKNFFEITEIAWALQMVRAVASTQARFPWLKTLSRLPLKLKKDEAADLWDKGGYAELASLADRHASKKELAALLESFSRVRDGLMQAERRQPSELSRPGALTAALAKLWRQWMAPRFEKMLERQKELRENGDTLNARKQAAERRVMYFFDIVQRAWWRKRNIRAVLERIESYGPRSDGEDKEASPVLLSTVHKSKGLEADTVIYLAGADVVNGASPSSEEDRRIFYVAITRPRERLIITESYSRPSLGKKAMNRAVSPFMGEVDEGIDRVDWTETDDLSVAIHAAV